MYLSTLLRVYFIIFLKSCLLARASSTNILETMLKFDTCGPPEILNAMMNQTVRPGEQAEFRCQIAMNKCMVSFINWYHGMLNGTYNKIKTAKSGDPHTHVIHKVEPLHEGVYKCEAGNVLGKATAQAYLQVYSGHSPPLHIPTKGLLLALLCCLLFTTNLLQTIPNLHINTQ